MVDYVTSDIKYIEVANYKISTYEPEYIQYIQKVYGFIYLTTNLINGKQYIGQAKIDKKGNWKTYLGSGTILKLAIKKYGRENFHRDIIHIAFNKNEMNFWERYYTVLFNCVNNDDWYNLIHGGLNGTSGRCGKDNPSARPVICLNTLEIFETEKQACDKYNLSQASLSSHCNGKRYYCGKVNNEKLVWMFLDEYNEEEAQEKIILANSKYDNSGENNPMYGRKGVLHHAYGKKRDEIKGGKNPSARKIICLTTNEIFETATEGANKYNANLSHVISCCKGKLQTSGKLKDGTKLQWAYYEDCVQKDNNNT